MDKTRLKRACVKAFAVVSACFILSVVLFAAVSAVFGWWIDPMILVSMCVMYLVLWVITAVRMFMDESRWALSKPYIVKNLIFMPFYFVVAMLFVVFAFGFDIVSIGFAAGAFLTVFLIMQTVVYLMSRKKTDLMNDALKQYQKEHFGDGQE